MRTPIFLVLALLLGAMIARAQLEDCPSLPQEGEGYYPANAPPFNVDTTNGGWSSDPPRFLDLDPPSDLCGSFFRYQGEDGAVHQDEDWFTLMDLSMTVWRVRIWTEGNRPCRYQLTDHEGNLMDCGWLTSGGERELQTMVGYNHLGISLDHEAPVGLPVAWRLRVDPAMTWDPCFPDNTTPDLAEPIQIPWDSWESCDFSTTNSLTAPLDLSHLLQPWHGAFDPLHTAQGGQVWFRFDLDRPLLLSAVRSSVIRGEVLVYQGTGTDRLLVLGGSTACGETLSMAQQLAAGSYLVALATDAGCCGMGRLQLEEQTCPPPAGLHAQAQGAAMELAWEAAPNATHYRVLGGDTPENLTQIAVVTEPRFVDTRALSHARRWYQVVSICE